MTETNLAAKPQVKPADPRFSSGPCKKRPGWALENLENAFLGRSHRAKDGKARLNEAIVRSRETLGIPDNYRVGIVPASDTGAVEMALWSLLGAAPVDVLVWESFGKGWATDITSQLKLDDVQVHEAPYGELPDLNEVRDEADVVFTWNGTTSGVKVPNGDWLKADREGLAICDATSAAFAQDLPWDKLDVVTWSWQKVMGGEAAHGMIVLSPKAVQRLETHTPAWPVPKIFRLTKKGELIEGVFAGATINTPSMLALEDYLDTLNWAEEIGGLPALHARCNANLAALEAWEAKTDWINFLCKDKASRSNTSVTLSFAEPDVMALPPEKQLQMVKDMAALLEAEEAALDVAGYRDAPPGFRIWCGATVESKDVEQLCPWLDWAYAQVRPNYL